MTTAHNNRVACYTPNEEKVESYRPRLDVSDAGTSYELHFDVPGAASFELSADNGTLQLRAKVASRTPEGVRPRALVEYGVADYERSVKLPDDVDINAIGARYEHGVLTVTAPKLERAGARTIPITMD